MRNVRRYRKNVIAASVALAVVFGAGAASGAHWLGASGGSEPLAVSCEQSGSCPSPTTVAAASTPVPAIPTATPVAVVQAAPPPVAPNTALNAEPSGEIPPPARDDAPAPDPAPTPGAPAPPAPPPAPAQPAAAPTAAPSTGSGPDCGNTCGDSPTFCDGWSGGFCDDFRDKNSGDVHVPFPGPGDPYTFTALASTDAGFDTRGDTDNGLRAFSANQHFMTVVDDPGFGAGILRVEQPLDFTGRETHIHFDVDLKTRSRRYVRMLLSPQITKAVLDDRGRDNLRPDDGLDLWFQGGSITASVYNHGQGALGNAFFSEDAGHVGVDDVRDHVDVYVSSGRLRVFIDGALHVDTPLPAMSFTSAYLYLEQVAYNPCKDGDCAHNLQVFHWDNVAFDGPVLPRNGLTPAGTREFAFLAYSANSCLVRGQQASHVGEPGWGAWITWEVNLPDDGTPVGEGDISCDYSFVDQGSDVPRALEIVRPG